MQVLVKKAGGKNPCVYHVNRWRMQFGSISGDVAQGRGGLPSQLLEKVLQEIKLQTLLNKGVLTSRPHRPSPTCPLFSLLNVDGSNISRLTAEI